MKLGLFKPFLPSLKTNADDRTVVGVVDESNSDFIRGWATKPGSQDLCRIVAKLNGKVIARTFASQYRPDVNEAEAAGGACGFHLQLPRGELNGPYVISVLDEASGLELRNSPVTIIHQPSIYVFDVSDLIFYLVHHDNPTGIQRVAISLISSFLNLDSGMTSTVRFVCYNDERLTFNEVSMPRFVSLLADLERPKGARAFPTGAGDVQAFRAALGISDTSFSAGRKGVLIMVGAAWVFHDYFVAVREFQRKGGRFICLIHDLIPLKMPSMCDKATAEVFKFFIRRASNFADILMAVSESTANDLKEYLKNHKIDAPPIRVLQNGDGLERGQFSDAQAPRSINGEYVLLVSTIEGRKNHQLIVEIWKRLIVAYGIGKVPLLVFVGRIGWRVEALIEDLYESNMLGGKVHIMSEISDDELISLYRDCLFTVYPSFYEGWGLPVGESLTYGKVCVASNRTSIPEVARDCALLADPADQDQFYKIVERLLIDKNYLRDQEEHIKVNFKPIRWRDVALKLQNCLHEALALPERNAFHVPLNLELTFRSLTYLRSGVSSGSQVIKQARKFSRPALTQVPLSLDNYVFSDLILDSGYWCHRSKWGRRSSPTQAADFCFSVTTTQPVSVYFRLRVPKIGLPAQIDISINHGLPRSVFINRKRILVRVDLEDNFLGEAYHVSMRIVDHKTEPGVFRPPGIGFEAMMIVETSDIAQRLNIVEFTK